MESMKSPHKLIRGLISSIGPWPIEPFHLGFLTALMVASIYSLGKDFSPVHSTKDVLIRPVFSVFIALLTIVQLKLTLRVVKNYQENLSLYLLILAIQSFSIWSWIVLFRYLFPEIHASFTTFLSPLPMLRFLFTLLSVNAFIGLSRKKLSVALAEKQDALRVVETQRNQLLEHDEKNRAQLSEFLHDRVQSSLVTACLKLQEIARRSEPAVSIDTKKVIAALEELRAVDVRNVSQTLSPAVGNADLHTSIALMVQSYAPHIDVSYQMSAALERVNSQTHPELFLGIYRITEQAFLNSHIHGNAIQFEIIIVVSDEILTLTTRNNGRPLPPRSEKGLGTAIINSWVRKLNGTWSLTNLANGEVELEAVLPL